MSKVIHFTTVHRRSDIRIRLKQVATLARCWPGDVALFVQDGLGDDADPDGSFRIHDVGIPSSNRLLRMTLGAWRMYRAVRRARPRIAHFHDPELLPWACLLRAHGIKTIYDAHEDLPSAVLSKPYLPGRLRKSIARIVGIVEHTLARLMWQVVAATPAIQQNFNASRTVLVQNFPLTSELVTHAVPADAKQAPRFAYVGGILRIRGAVEMVQAIDLMQDESVRLHIAGSASEALGAQLRQIPGWQRVTFHGQLERRQMAEMLASCRAGLVLFHPEPNHVRAQPNKMFEYMSAGLPVIASDFPLWRQIIEGAECGLLVNPNDPQAIANAMQWMLDHPEDAVRMGKNGRLAIETDYNWESESAALVSLYRRLLPITGAAG